MNMTELNMELFGVWEEAGAPGENPRRHAETPDWESSSCEAVKFKPDINMSGLNFWNLLSTNVNEQM